MYPDALTTAERLVWDAVPTGSAVDLTGAPDPVVRAEVVAALLLGAQTARPGATAALVLTGARITGPLKLGFAEVSCPLLLTRCVLDTRPDLYWARMDYVGLRECQMPGIQASSIQISRHLELSGAVIQGELRLRGARIAGGLLLVGARLDGGGGQAMSAERLEVGGDLAMQDLTATGGVRLFRSVVGGSIGMDRAVMSADGADGTLRAESIEVSGGFYARHAAITGGVVLRHARVDGAVAFTGAVLSAPGGAAFDADRADIDGGLYLDGSLRASGECRAVHARIGRSLIMADAVLENPGGVAFRADTATIDGGIDARRLRTAGEVILTHATINGAVRMEAATLDNPGGKALTCSGVNASLIFNCCDGFTARGRVGFTGARVGSRLCFNDAVLVTPGGTALRCRGLQTPELTVYWTVPPEGIVDLRYARIGVLRDEAGRWPTEVRLDGLVYDSLEPALGAPARLAVLARDADGYRPHPYEQLAAAYRRLGQDGDARAVLVARQRRQTAALRRPGRLWGAVQDLTVGYGYRPLRAAAWLAAVLTAGTVVFGLHPPPPVDPPGPGFDPLLYTLDVLLPLVDLGQQDAFTPEGGYRWLTYALIAAGWVLATTVAAGTARSLRRD